MGPAEVYGGIGAFKAMFDIAKAMKDISDVAQRNIAVIELTEQILAAQAAQTALLHKVDALEAELLATKQWDAEKSKYELKNLGASSFAYMLKPDARGTEPPHWVCQKCYSDKKIYVIQSSQEFRKFKFACPNCKNSVDPFPFVFKPEGEGVIGEIMPKSLRWLD